jgi:hypothetical protein
LIEGLGEAITAATIAEAAFFRRSNEDEVQIDHRSVGVIVRGIDRCSDWHGPGCAPG